MNFLSLFVLIPLLMLLGLWLSRNISQIRTVMVTGASALLALSIALTVMYLQARQGGARRTRCCFAPTLPGIRLSTYTIR